MNCLGLNLFYEARGEPDLGKKWVLDVVRNRVDRPDFPNTVCEVIQEDNAFTWYTALKIFLPADEKYWAIPIRLFYQDDPVELTALENSLIFARAYLEENPSDSTGGAVYYMTINVVNSGKMHKQATYFNSTGWVGHHIFFDYINWR